MEDEKWKQLVELAKEVLVEEGLALANGKLTDKGIREATKIYFLHHAFLTRAQHFVPNVKK